MKVTSMAKLLVCAAVLVWHSYAIAQGGVVSVNFCHVDQDEYPWVMQTGAGVSQQMIRRLEEKLSIKVSFSAMPWKRCLAELREGNMDGAFRSSFKEERMAMGAYPMNEGKPDSTKRLHDESYSLYVVKGSRVEWDGRVFKNLTGAIGAPSGYSIVDFLKSRGVAVDDGGKDALSNLKKVVAGRLEGAALQTVVGDCLLQGDAELASKIDKVKIPLEEKPYYLMLSHRFVNGNPRMAKEIWEKVAVLRESPETKKALEAVLRK
jgi:polar amino acid transport system substrate-binding protein